MYRQEPSFFLKFLKAFALVFIIGNIFFIDYTIYKQNKTQDLTIQNPSSSTVISNQQDFEKTQAQLNTLNTKLTTMAQNLTITPQSQGAAVQQTIGPREFYIPFGSGSGQSMDWTDVPGLQSSIDTSLYPQMQVVTFEVGGHTPTGNQIVWVRLYNVTFNHPVWNSDVSWTGGGSQYVISSPITLDGGNTVYKIQMKTQVGAQSFIDQAKVHIVLY